MAFEKLSSSQAVRCVLNMKLMFIPPPPPPRQCFWQLWLQMCIFALHVRTDPRDSDSQNNRFTSSRPSPLGNCVRGLHVQFELSCYRWRPGSAAPSWWWSCSRHILISFPCLQLICSLSVCLFEPNARFQLRVLWGLLIESVPNKIPQKQLQTFLH